MSALISQVAMADSLTYYSARSDTFDLRYGLPPGFEFTSGGRREVVQFPVKRPYPLPALIAAVGKGQPRGRPGVFRLSFDIMVFKLSKPRFAPGFDLKDMQGVLVEEKASLPVAGKSSAVVTDRHGRRWLQTIVVSSDGTLAARSFARPVDEDKFLSVHMNLEPDATKDEIAKGPIIEDQIIDGLEIRPDRY